MIFNIMVAYSVPVVVWIILKRKNAARTFPLIVGMISYIFISLLRGVARLVVLNDGVRANPWMFYILSALLSGIFEEVGRYIVFRYGIPGQNKWADCVCYGIGHGGTEVFLTHYTLDNNLFESLIDCHEFLDAMIFSTVMSVLVFSAVHYAFDKKLLFLAIGLHTAVDIIPALYWRDILNASEFDFIEVLYRIVICYLAYRVYRYYKEYYSNDKEEI